MRLTILLLNKTVIVVSVTCREATRPSAGSQVTQPDTHRGIAAVTWYATAGHDPADVHQRRSLSPWYTSEAEPATADMAAKVRRVIIAARFKESRAEQPTPPEIAVIRLAWEEIEYLAAVSGLKRESRDVFVRDKKR